MSTRTDQYNDQSYYYFMNENLFSKVNIDRNRTFLPDGTEPTAKRHAMHTIRSSTLSAA